MRLILVIMLVLMLLLAGSVTASTRGDPLDTNDGPATADMDNELHCESLLQGNINTFNVWQCDVYLASVAGGWWDNPWY